MYLVDLTPAAFTSTVARVAPFFADRCNDDWQVVLGFLNGLSDLLPAAGFQAEDDGPRFAPLLASGSHLCGYAAASLPLG